MGDFFVQLYGRSALMPPLMEPLLSVCEANNTERTFSMFSKDPSRSLTLSQHCTRHALWATKLSKLACFLPPFSIHWYAAFSAMGKLAWAFVSKGWAVSSISTKQAFYSLKPPGKSYVPQVGVRLVRMAYFRFYNFPKIVFMYKLSVHDKHERVHWGFSYPENFVWWD